jgi:hypothetical protein
MSLSQLHSILNSSIHQMSLSQLRSILNSSIHQMSLSQLHSILNSSIHQMSLSQLLSILNSSNHHMSLWQLLSILNSSIHQMQTTCTHTILPPNNGIYQINLLDKSCTIYFECGNVNWEEDFCVLSHYTLTCKLVPQFHAEFHKIQKNTQINKASLKTT